MNLRVKTSKGQKTVQVEPTISIPDLCRLVDVSFPEIRVLVGFPPKRIEFTDTQSLEDSGISNGDVVILEEISKSLNKETMETEQSQTTTTTKKLDNDGEDDDDFSILREVVPSDNSCLFTSVNFCLSGKVNSDKGDLMRQIVAAEIDSDRAKYSPAILGRDNDDYRAWILTPDAWGGAIEAQILAEYFGVEIAVLDTLSGSVTHFGENVKAGHRMLIIYDGIHYDPLYVEFRRNPKDPSSTEQRTLHPIEDVRVVEKAKEFAREAQIAGQFTDLQNFKLKCEVCGAKLKGQTDAQAHAKSTGHTQFGEV